MVPFAVAGIVVWAVVGLVLLLFFRGWLLDHGRENWLWTCLAGFLLGFPGLAVMIRHDANRRRRRAASSAER
jgi:F0F1-type ATP synthase assembly protein I